MEEKEFYRYEITEYACLDADGYPIISEFSAPAVELKTFNLFKETIKGYWIGFGRPGEFHSTKRWVSKTSRKRYAYPTKEEALTNFILRTERRSRILRRQANTCDAAVTIANRMKLKHNIV